MTTLIMMMRTGTLLLICKVVYYYKMAYSFSHTTCEKSSYVSTSRRFSPCLSNQLLISQHNEQNHVKNSSLRPSSPHPHFGMSRVAEAQQLYVRENSLYVHSSQNEKTIMIIIKVVSEI